MKHLLELALPPEIAFDTRALEAHVIQLLKYPASPLQFRLLRRSIDARSRRVKVNLNLEVYLGEFPPALLAYDPQKLPSVQKAPQALVIGAGPGGMFAALRLIELGIKPILIERGKDVRARRRDLAALTDHLVNPESNYCFGEGGAGTYSDGKLYTRSKKRGDVRRILEILVAHGASPDILVDAHPHIGTNKLPGVVTALRETIRACGGEVYFNTRMDDLIIQDNTLMGICTQQGDKLEGIGVILATGHSARDVFELLHRRGIYLEAKPFAMGLRVEHAQSLVDALQYKLPSRGPYLPAAAYSWVEQVVYKQLPRGVFSFCMCPGGYIVPAATAPGEVVVNGMSPSRRDSKFANSGIVMSVEAESWQAYTAKHGLMAGLALQQKLEQDACQIAGGRQSAPAQRLADFVAGKPSSSLLPCSYQPGLSSVQLSDFLPAEMSSRLRQAFQLVGQKMKGYLTNEAQLVGVESRTSSPIRIPRHKDTFEHLSLKRLFPCGEGAGYAGGIVSAAMDGERCAENLAKLYASGL
jgi:uncharacterized FAD-dependent dehydrogenase